MAARIIGVAAVLISVVVACIALVSLEIFGGPTGGYSGLHPAALVFVSVPLLGLVLIVTAIRKRASGGLIFLAGAVPLLGQAFIFFAFVQIGALA